MKILVATGIYPPQIGGPATYSKLLFDELPDRGISVDVQSFGDFIDKPKIIRHFLYFLSVLKNARDADIIYAQDPVSVGLPALLVSQILRKKFVVKIVGDYAWEQGVQRFGVKDNLDVFSKKYSKYSKQVKTLKRIEQYVAERALAIITPSEYLKKIISNWGIDKNKIKVIYNGFNLNVPKTTKTILRKRFGFYSTVIISAGRLVPWKGFDGLIRSFVVVSETIKDACLNIVGDGPEMENLKKLTRELGLDEKVKFLGKLEQKELFDHIKASDIFVLNTEYEGFSHQIIETMAIGTPIITTRVGGNPEAIEDRKTGLLVGYNQIESIRSSILELVRSPSLTTSISKKAKIRVKEFTDKRMLEETVQFLKSLI